MEFPVKTCYLVPPLGTTFDRVTTAVSNETKARVSAIDTLSGSLTSEITTRSNVDIIHSTQINTLQDGLAKELKDRKSADDALQLQIDAKASAADLFTQF